MSIGVICGYSASVISVAPTPLSSSCLCVVVVTPSATPQNCSAALQNILTPNSQVLTSLPRNLSNAIRGVGIEPSEKTRHSPEKQQIPVAAQPNAQPSVAPDSDLSAIIENWNLLGPSIKLAIMALVRIALESERK